VHSPTEKVHIQIVESHGNENLDFAGLESHGIRARS